MTDLVARSKAPQQKIPFQSSPPCSSAHDEKSCETLSECYWCGDLVEKFSWKCFEGSLWKCPRRPECQRAEEEYWGYRIGDPSPLIIVISFTCFILTALLFKRKCADKPLQKQKLFQQQQRLLCSNDSHLLNTPLILDGSESELDEYVVLNQIPPLHDPWESTNQAGTAPIVRTVRKQVSRVLLLFACAVSTLCFITLLMSPAPPVFTACDIRWDLGSVQQTRNDGNGGGDRDEKGRVHILAEISISIWNTNRFDLDVAAAKGEIYFHDGKFARFHWEPRNGLVRISAGHVYDTRVVMSVDWDAVEKVPSLIEDWASADGIILSLDANAYMSFRILGVETPKLFLGAGGILLPLNQADRNLCRCTV
jgi:hypothetical protein